MKIILKSPQNCIATASWYTWDCGNIEKASTALTMESFGYEKTMNTALAYIVTKTKSHDHFRTVLALFKQNLKDLAHLFHKQIWFLLYKS